MDGRYRALLIGNANFHATASLNRLHSPLGDVEALADALTDPVFGLFDTSDVVTCLDEDSRTIIGLADALFQTAGREDVLLFYYSGHGVPGVTANLHLCARDTRTDRLFSTSLSSDQLNALIAACPARAVITVLDCCYSGAFKGGPLAEMVAGRYVLASSRATEVSKEGPEGDRLSVYTAHLIDGLGKAAPRTSPDFLTVEDLHEYVRDRVSFDSPQRPQLQVRGDGGLPIAMRTEDVPLEAAEWQGAAAGTEVVLPIGSMGSVRLCQVPRGRVWTGGLNAWVDDRSEWDDSDGAYLALPTFYISKYPVTAAEYRLFLDDELGYAQPAWWMDYHSNENFEWARMQPPESSPLETAPQLVTRFQAIAYCRWLSARTLRRFVVPTEHHWLRAARGDSRARYPWGEEFDRTRCGCDDGLTPVDGFPSGASRFGVVDLVGNTPEWVALATSGEAAEALTGTASAPMCEMSGVFHPRGTSADATDPFHYSCDYRGVTWAPAPSHPAGFRVSTPAFRLQTSDPLG